MSWDLEHHLAEILEEHAAEAPLSPDPDRLRFALFARRERRGNRRTLVLVAAAVAGLFGVGAYASTSLVGDRDDQKESLFDLDEVSTTTTGAPLTSSAPSTAGTTPTTITVPSPTVVSSAAAPPDTTASGPAPTAAAPTTGKGRPVAPTTAPPVASPPSTGVGSSPSTSAPTTSTSAPTTSTSLPAPVPTTVAPSPSTTATPGITLCINGVCPPTTVAPGDRLTIATPADNAVLAGGTIEVRGLAEPGWTVTVNGVVASTNFSGSYSATLLLPPGVHTITVAATDGTKTLSDQVTVTVT